MNFKQLSYFVRILDCGSFSQAAVELHVSSPTLGEHVRNLEAELGVDLLIRHARGVGPTPAGALLRERAQHILESVELTVQELRAFDHTPRGSVTLGITPGLSEMIAAPLVQRCHARWPALVLNVVEELSSVLIERIARDSEPISMALVSGYDAMSAAGLRAEAVAVEQLFVVGTPQRLGHGAKTLCLRELAQLPLIMLGSGSAQHPHGLRRLVMQQAAAQDLTLTIAFEMRSIAAVRELVEQDVGVAILPYGAVRRRVAEGALVARALIEPEITRELTLVHARRRPWNQADAAVRNLVLELLREQIKAPRSVLRPVVGD